MTTLIASTPFLNILVSVKPGTQAGQYNVQTAPANPYVTQLDTVINYQIFESDGLDIVFTGMSVVPAHNTQLSAAVVSLSGKQLTFTDAATNAETFNVTLNFQDKEGVQFMHDPQIRNDPDQP